MGKLGRTYTRADYAIHTGQNAPAAAYRQLGQSLTQGDNLAIRHKITAAVVAVICVLGFVGWILTRG